MSGGLKTVVGGKGEGLWSDGFSIDCVGVVSEADSDTGGSVGSGVRLDDEEVVKAVCAVEALGGAPKTDDGADSVERFGGAVEIIAVIDSTSKLSGVAAVGVEVEIIVVSLMEVMIVWDLGLSAGAVSFWLAQRRNCNVDLRSRSRTRSAAFFINARETSMVPSAAQG